MNTQDNPPRNRGRNQGENWNKDRQNFRQQRNHTPRNVEILPSPEILESYNYVVEGSAAKIIDMFEREQLQRHEWENQALKVHALSTVLGQILGFAVAGYAISVSAYLGLQGEVLLAGAFLGAFVVASLGWAYVRSIASRQYGGRPFRKNFATRDFRDRSDRGYKEEDAS